jgi:hypothetical protein
MKRADLVKVLIWVGALALLIPQVQAQVAGRVLLAAGDTVAVRDGKEIRLTTGTAIHGRDTLRTGTASNLQVRLTDQSIVSLREQSELRIDEYRFTGQDGSDERAFFRLLKGGFRTITGLIGRTNPKNYAVGTATATIGIRGTMYALAHCQQDCRNLDGSLAADGVYGTVHGPSHGTDTVTVSNKSGESVFGMNQHFHVAEITSPPTQLIEPPPFLQDRLGGAKPTGRPTAAAPEQGGAKGESRPSAWPNLLTDLITNPTINITPMRSASLGVDPTFSGSVPGGAADLHAGGFSAALTINGVDVVFQPVFQPVGGTGIIRGQLVWLTNADMDLHMNAPTGEHVFFGNTTVTLAGGAIAALDADNLGGVINVPPDMRIENIRVSGGTPPLGNYDFFVHAFSRGDTTTSVLTLTGDGGATFRTYNVPALPGRGTSQFFTVIFNGLGVAPGYSP